MVKKYKSRVISVRNQIEGLYTLELKSLTDRYKYLPGQFLHLAIDENYEGIDQWPESRCFSMQSNPEEENITITYAVKGRFTKQIEQLIKVGSEVWLKLPYGDLLTQPHNRRSTVFIAGGTGITPFLSLFTHRSFRDYIKPRIYLGFRSQAYNIYGKELSLIQFNENLIQHCKPMIFYDDLNGQLDIQNIVNENGNKCDYFISGPPEMIKSFKIFLTQRAINVSQIHTDIWE